MLGDKSTEYFLIFRNTQTGDGKCIGVNKYRGKIVFAVKITELVMFP